MNVIKITKISFNCASKTVSRVYTSKTSNDSNTNITNKRNVNKIKLRKTDFIPTQ
jgi:hypothetical protein